MEEATLPHLTHSCMTNLLRRRANSSTGIKLVCINYNQHSLAKAGDHCIKLVFIFLKGGTLFRTGDSHP